MDIYGKICFFLVWLGQQIELGDKMITMYRKMFCLRHRIARGRAAHAHKSCSIIDLIGRFKRMNMR